MSEVKKCLICKPAGDLSTEEIPYWSKKWVIIHLIQK